VVAAPQERRLSLAPTSPARISRAGLLCSFTRNARNGAPRTKQGNQRNVPKHTPRGGGNRDRRLTCKSRPD
jgi:hypothetical protein